MHPIIFNGFFPPLFLLAMPILKYMAFVLVIWRELTKCDVHLRTVRSRRFGLSALLFSPLVRPELDVPVLAQGATLDELALFAHEVLDRQLLVAKDAKVVANDMTIAALGAGDENGAGVVTLLGDIVVGAVAAGDAGEGELVVGAGLDRGTLALGRGRFGVCFAGGFPRLDRRRFGDGVGGADKGEALRMVNW